MAIINKGFIDMMQNFSIVDAYAEIKALQERVDRLEKLTNELYKEIKQLNSEKEKKIEEKKRQERIVKREKEQKYHLNDHVIITKDITINGKELCKGTKGIIDNRITSSRGVQYIIKLDDDGSTIGVAEEHFEVVK